LTVSIWIFLHEGISLTGGTWFFLCTRCFNIWWKNIYACFWRCFVNIKIFWFFLWLNPCEILLLIGTLFAFKLTNRSLTRNRSKNSYFFVCKFWGCQRTFWLISCKLLNILQNFFIQRLWAIYLVILTILKPLNVLISRSIAVGNL